MPNYSNNTKRSWMAVDLGKGRKLIPSRYCVRCVICPCTCLLFSSICLLMVRLFVCQSISVRLCGRASLCLSVYLSVCLSVCLFGCVSVCLSICVSVCLFVCVFVCLSVFVSVLYYEHLNTIKINCFIDT